jgi:hypothetical protein
LLVSYYQKSLIEADKTFASSSTSVLIWIYIGGYTPILVNKLKKIKYIELVCALRTHVRAPPPPPLSGSREHQALTIAAGGGTPMSPHPRSTAERGPAQPPTSVPPLAGPPPSRYGLRGPSRAPTADPSPLGEAHVAPLMRPLPLTGRPSAAPLVGPLPPLGGPCDPCACADADAGAPAMGPPPPRESRCEKAERETIERERES